MKTHKVVGLTLFLGILLIISGIIIGKAVNIKLSEMNGYFGMEKVIVTQKNVDTDNSNPITIRDIKRIKKAMEDTDVSYSSSLMTYVKGNNRDATAELIGTNSVYSKFSLLQFAAGSFFTEEAEKESSRVAVIDEKLAIKLFNTSKVIGNKISIYNQSFSIIGVISTDSSLLQGLIDDDIPSIYIPGSTFFEFNDTSAITHIEIKSLNNDTLGNNSKLVAKGLESIGQNPQNYNIIDFNIEEALIKQKPDILMFLVGLISILVLVLYIKREFGRVLGLLIREAKSDYISSIVRANSFKIILLVIKTIAVALFTIIIWKLIKFSLYIPPEYIPTDLTDMGYFGDLIYKTITSRNSNMGYIPFTSERLLDISQRITNISFIISLFPGFIIFYIGIYQARALKIDSFKLLLQSGISLLLSAILLTGLIFYFDINFYVNSTTFVVLWIFICINVVKFGSEAEKREMVSTSKEAAKHIKQDKHIFG